MTVPTLTLNSGRTMPQLGLGMWQASNEETEAAVTAALGSGYRLIDTAQVYANEEGVGRALAATTVPREELFITTKTIWVFGRVLEAGASIRVFVGCQLLRAGLSTRRMEAPVEIPAYERRFGRARAQCRGMRDR